MGSNTFRFQGRPHFKLELLRNVNTALGTRALLDHIDPLLNLRERLCVDASPFGPVDPGEAADVSNSILGTNLDTIAVSEHQRINLKNTHQPKTLTSRLLRNQPVIQHLVKTLALVYISIDAVLNLLRCIAVEVVRLLHLALGWPLQVLADGYVHLALALCQTA